MDYSGANILITGSCRTGKSRIACAFTHKDCLEGHQAPYSPATLVRFCNRVETASLVTFVVKSRSKKLLSRMICL